VAQRDNPYGAFKFRVKLGNAGGDDRTVAGFSDVSGLGTELKDSEYRNGNDQENHVRKVPNVNSTDDIILKRGVIGDQGLLMTWLKNTREGTLDPRTVTVTLFDEGRSPVCSWILQQAQPKKWVGPALTAKGGGEVAIEELHLVAERIDFQSTSQQR
jgi:phage tail-like protein